VLRAKTQKKNRTLEAQNCLRKGSEFQGILRSGSMLVMPEMQLSHATATTPFKRKNENKLNR